MPEQLFLRRAAGDALLVLEPAAGMPGAPGLGVAFLPGGAPPAQLALAASWDDPLGIYLFLPALPADQAAFRAALRTHLRFAPRARFVWLANPEAEPFRWRTVLIAVARPSPAGPAVIADATVIGLGDAALTLGAGCPVALLPAGEGSAAFAITRPAGGTRAFSFGSGGGLGRTYGLGAAVTLALSGEGAGCLLFDLTVQNGELAALDAAARYFYDPPEYPGFDLLASLRYPWFEETATVSLSVSLDPLQPTEGRRTFFALAAGPGVPSHLRTPLGQPVALGQAGEAEAARLVFSPRPLGKVPGPADPLYLTPRGAFSVEAAEGRLQCGISGVEQAALPPGGRMHFFPGQSAYAARLAGAAREAPLLDGPATTAWAFFAPPASPAPAAPVLYYAQPDEGLLYEADDATAAEFLDFLDIPAATLVRTVVPPATSPAEDPAATAFPLVPYAGLDGRRAPLARRLEKEALAPLRRRIVERLTEPAPVPPPYDPEPGDRVATTPQGLLARFRADGAWKTLMLARTGAEQVRWHGLTGWLRAALQRSDVFLVVSDPAQLAPFTQGGPPGRLTLAGWSFHLSPEDWAEPGTILVIKLQEGTLRELAADPSRWTAAGELNPDVAAVRSRLLATIDEAVAKSAAEPAFAPFARLATGPWNGVLFLRAKVPLDDLPEQLQGLAAGIDASRFFAHHVGLNLTPVEGREEGLEVGDSSLFGLLHYEDPEHQFAAGQPHAFKVLSLKVRFQNSAIAEFSSRIELLVNRLFDEPANLVGGEAGNNLLFDGIYQKQGEEESYLFLQQGSNVFRVESRVLAEVETVKAQFVTVVPPGGLVPGEVVRTRFLLWGNVRFRELPQVDLFSFGKLLGEGGAVLADGQLAFAYLAVDMAFPPASPGEKAFTFDARALAFDLARSRPRPESLFRRFPLKLTGLVQAAPGTKTADLGFIPMTSPLPQAALADPWYGLTFDIDLGSLGALAGGKHLTVTLLAGWGKGAAPGQTPVFLGMKIPGTEGGRPQIPIEGILKLTLKRIELAVVPAETGGRAYLLRFNRIALSLFGFSFPPGRTDIVLFGNPEGGDDKTVGWYAAYLKDFTPPPPPGGAL